MVMILQEKITLMVNFEIKPMKIAISIPKQLNMTAFVHFTIKLQFES